MDIFDVLDLIGGLCLFMLGMSLMGNALEHRAGGGLKAILGKLTNSKLAGLLTGVGVTAVIQSSSATTVMVVGFVNSGLMSLRQAVHVIMGANIGTTVTSWILSLAGIDSDNIFVSLLKPSAFTPILALIGTVLLMTGKNEKKKDSGMILLGFFALMYGMNGMSAAVAGLQDIPGFREMFIAFSNPFLGLLAGVVLTALIQSSSASVGILQALSSTGAVTYGMAVPIIIGQNIGTCITVILSSIGTTKNAKRAALVHLSFNVIGATVWIVIFSLVKSLAAPAILSESASLAGIAVVHSAFNLLSTALLLPFAGRLEKLVCRLIPDAEEEEHMAELDERLLVSPALALEQSKAVLEKMGQTAIRALKNSIETVRRYDEKKANSIREDEETTDHLEDILSTYLLKLTARNLREYESAQATEYMKLIGDYERIGDHATDILRSAKEMAEKKIAFSAFAEEEYDTLAAAITDILDTSYRAFAEGDLTCARRVEPLEQVIDHIKEVLRTRHIKRLQQRQCSVEAGFVWADILTALERVSDHCSNIAGCVIDMAEHNMNIHENIRQFRDSDEEFRRNYDEYDALYRKRLKSVQSL